MLLKSSSNTALNSWFKQQSESNSITHQNLKSPTKISFNSPKKKQITRTLSDSDLICFNRSIRVNCLRSSCVDVLEDVESEGIESDGVLFSSCSLDGNEGCEVEFLMDGIGGGGGGGGGGGSGGGGSGCGNGGYDDGTDIYYQNMIKANPNNSLILGNYAKYLKEIRGDVLKAEEFCSRAILANPNDGNALSMYASLIWETQNDSSRAQTYFDQAVKAAPDDCYVMASYARFLWDADEEEEDVSDLSISAPSFLQEASQQFPIAAAS